MAGASDGNQTPGKRAAKAGAHAGASAQGALAMVRPYWQKPERGTAPAFALALLFHALLFLFFYIGLNWQIRTPAGVEAELWADIPPASAYPPTPPPVSTQPPPPRQAEPSAPTRDEDAEIALALRKKRQADQDAECQRQVEEDRRRAELYAQRERETIAREKQAQGLARQRAEAEAARKDAEMKKQRELLERQACRKGQVESEAGKKGAAAQGAAGGAGQAQRQGVRR
ncbi:MAG: hypothetical protein MO853_11500 [Candidatus Protistobacter heckmanni]|nr:hypothetical protein [Candidatus Protistobacter heckmanni]